VSKIVNRDGITILDDQARPGEAVVAPDIAQCAQNVLRGVITGGTGGAAAVGGHTAYGKTGTTDNTTDAWFIGATPQLATAVWFGFPASGQQGGAGFGGASSAPIFSDFMTRALDGTPDLGLPPAGPVCGRGGQRVDENGGRTTAAAPVLDLPTAPTPQPTVVQAPTTTAAATTTTVTTLPQGKQ